MLVEFWSTRMSQFDIHHLVTSWETVIRKEVKSLGLKCSSGIQLANDPEWSESCPITEQSRFFGKLLLRISCGKWDLSRYESDTLESHNVENEWDPKELFA